MKKINTKAIRIDGATQSRVEINNDAVQDYAEALKAGAVFPPVVVFFDGADYWLADGFHRWHAHNTAGLTSIGADVHQGTQRDAMLFSYAANSDHGLRRTNADKRKIATAMLADEDWSQWTSSEIARHCGISHTFVNKCRDKLHTLNVSSMKLQERKFIHPKTGKETVMNTANIGKKPVQAEPVKEPANEFEGQDFGPCAEEIEAAQRIEREQLENLVSIAESDEPLKDALATVKRLTAENRVLSDRNNGLMNENAVLKGTVKSLQRKLKEAEAANA